MCGSEAEQGLKSGHRCLPSIVTENELIQVNLELLATHAVVGADQPLLQVPNGPIRQWHHRFRAFAKVALKGLGVWHMPEAHLLKTGEAFETVRVDGRAGSHILLDKSLQGNALEVRDDRHAYSP